MSNLPVRTDEDFIADIESMDLSALQDKSFVVGVSQGDRNGCKFLSSTVRGPYTFVEMVEQVGLMWREHQHHAKVTVLSKDPNEDAPFLDENTTDYIECHYEDIVTEAMLGGVFDEIKEYTCRAGLTTETQDEDPRTQKQLEAPKEEVNDDL